MMRNLLMIGCIIVANSVFGQLAIKDSTYIYIKDEIVHVENNIALIDTTSAIYLREDGQLTQGNGSTPNTGRGYVSAYQEGTVNHFNYNFWCSPVGNVDVDIVGNTNFRPNLIDDPLLDTDLTIDSNDAEFVIFDEGESSPLTIAEKWIYKYIASTNYDGWLYVGQDGEIEPGLGFSMKGMGSGTYGNQTYDFRGKPNNGTISNLVKTGANTLIGNPYPSALDALKFIHDTNNASTINGVLYYWEQAPGDGTESHYLVDYEGGYASYTISSDGSVESFTKATFKTYNDDGEEVSTVGTSTSSKHAERYIPIGQGFVVEGVADGVVRTTNDHRIFYKKSEPKSEFFRQRNTGDSNYEHTMADDLQRLRIYVDFNETYTRELLMNFHPNTTTQHDYGLEAASPEGVESDAYLMLKKEPMVITAEPFFEDMTIPVAINLAETKTIRIRLADLENFDADQSVYLYDKLLEQYSDLRNTDYEIKNLDAGIYDSRFEITFKNQTLSEKDFQLQGISVLVDNKQQQIHIRNPKGLEINDVEILDISGKRILFRNLNSSNTNLSYPTDQFSDGVYIVKLSSTERGLLTKKLVVKKIL